MLRLRVYRHGVGSSPTAAPPAAAAYSSQGTRRRRAASQAEQARRKAWGATYGNVMAQIKRDRERSTG